MTTKTWNAALWTAQTLMSVLFGVAGFMKSTAPIEELRMMIPWVADAPVLARIVGACELMGAIGLLVPSLLRIRPMILLASVRMLGLLMICAMFFHILRGEFPMLGMNISFLLIFFFIAYGRSHVAVIAPRAKQVPSTL